jgi:hypothetical protein
VGGQEVTVPEILGAIEDSCDVDERLRRIARPSPPRDAPAPVALRRGRGGGSPAAKALAEAGSTINAVAQAAGASTSAVSRWLTGEHAYPDQLPDVLEQLLGADAIWPILALIPAASIAR